MIIDPDTKKEIHDLVNITREYVNAVNKGNTLSYRLEMLHENINGLEKSINNKYTRLGTLIRNLLDFKNYSFKQIVELLTSFNIYI